MPKTLSATDWQERKRAAKLAQRRRGRAKRAKLRTRRSGQRELF
jgi:hypothetical protein